MTSPNFRVLIAGGGPVGLTAALALSKANIKFTLLEKHAKIVSDAGSDLVLSPIGQRALSQLGLYEQLSTTSTPLGVIQRIDHNGDDLGQVKLFDYMRENFGAPPRVIRRQDLCKVLLSHLPQSRDIVCNKEICDIKETLTGVVATCSDGSSYEGDIIIGADGVHSKVRNHINKSNKTQESNRQEYFAASYICLWMRFPADGLTAGSTFETHGCGASTQMFVSPHHAVAGIYVKLSVPIMERRKFTEEEEEELVRRWKDLPLCTDKKITLGAMHDRRISSGLVSLHEGVHTTWSSDGRSVLAGDAVHVFSPITGAGCNNGIIDVVVLVNELHTLLDRSDGKPGTPDLRLAFESYQSCRKQEVVAQCEMASNVAATASWQSTFRRLIDQYVVSLGWVQSLLAKRVSAEIASTPTFDFLPEDMHIKGKIPWKAKELVVK